MFHRRVVLLFFVTVVVTAALVLQMMNLTVVHGKALREEAESALVYRSTIPTIRGRIMDRQGRILAVDRPAYNVAVSYKVICGKWAYEQARQEAYRAHRDDWSELSFAEREALIDQYLPRYEQEVQALWRTLANAEGIPVNELEQRRVDVVKRVQQVASYLWMRWYEQRTAAFDSDVEYADVAKEVAQQVEKHVLVEPRDNDVLLRITRQVNAATDKANKDDESLAIWKEVAIKDGRRRDYPFRTLSLMMDRSGMPATLKKDMPVEVTVEDVASHIIGDMRPVWAEDINGDALQGIVARPFALDGSIVDLGGYRPGDQRGSYGIEAAQEDTLRGTLGLEIRRIDSGRISRTEPVAGNDVTLSIDINLQARLEALMNPKLGLARVQEWHGPRAHEKSPHLGEPLYGAAIVLDIATGEVLAAVSTPSRHAQGPSDEPMWDRIYTPFINRVIARPYQPGSTVKPLVLAAAASEHHIAPGHTIECHGHLFPDQADKYRCWIFKMFSHTHGPLTGEEAIMRSCNIFFYTLGQRMGAARMNQWYERFGLGAVTDCGLPDELAGTGSKGNSIDDARFLGIGQGPVTWTLIQAASAYATLANGGKRVHPTFLHQASERQTNADDDLHLRPSGVRMALTGLKMAVNESDGTTNHITWGVNHREDIFNLPGVTVAGKSGTAQASPLWIDLDGNGKLNLAEEIKRGGDHSWFVGLVQRADSTRPDYVIAVIVEYAGSGGRVSGPIANQILYALRAEGYL